MNTPTAITRRTTDTLRAAIHGEVFVPGEAGYDQARQAWNLTADQRPSVVVFAGSAADAARAVRFARAQGMRIAPQGTGHGAPPPEPVDGAMLLRTSRMRGVRIDPAARTARAEAGAQWQDVTVPAGEDGLAALAGSSPGVGVTGYTLGGGLGWLARRYGLAANSVTAAELVTPDGRLARAGAGREPDLFWAVRGGGGSAPAVGTSAAGGVALALRHTALGTILTTGQGFTVYAFEADHGAMSACTGACAAAWPPVTTSSARIAVDGAAAGSLTGEITRAGGVHQLTYAGHPLYRFAGDSSPGATNGQGSEAFGARWDVLTPAGQEVTGG